MSQVEKNVVLFGFQGFFSNKTVLINESVLFPVQKTRVKPGTVLIETVLSKAGQESL